MINDKRKKDHLPYLECQGTQKSSPISTGSHKSSLTPHSQKLAEHMIKRQLEREHARNLSKNLSKQPGFSPPKRAGVPAKGNLLLNADNNSNISLLILNRLNDTGLSFELRTSCSYVTTNGMTLRCISVLQVLSVFQGELRTHIVLINK
jgi:hypothetical protein